MEKENGFHRMEITEIARDRYNYLSPSEIMDEQREIQEATQRIREKYDALANYRKQQAQH